MTPTQQRLAAVLTLVLGGVAVDVAISQSGSTQDEVDAAIVDAAYALKDTGQSVVTIPATIAAATGVDVEVVRTLVDRATLAEDRDPRAIRSETLRMLVAVGDVSSQSSTYAQAVCEPLALAPDLYAACVPLQGYGTGRPVCSGTHVYVEALATPGTAERARDTMTATTFDVDDDDPCGDTEPQGDPNLSNP